MLLATSWAADLPISISWLSETREISLLPVTGLVAQPEPPTRAAPSSREVAKRRGIDGSLTWRSAEPADPDKLTRCGGGGCDPDSRRAAAADPLPEPGDGPGEALLEL